MLHCKLQLTPWYSHFSSRSHECTCCSIWSSSQRLEKDETAQCKQVLTRSPWAGSIRKRDLKVSSQDMVLGMACRFATTANEIQISVRRHPLMRPLDFNPGHVHRRKVLPPCEALRHHVLLAGAKPGELAEGLWLQRVRTQWNCQGYANLFVVASCYY